MISEDQKNITTQNKLFYKQIRVVLKSVDF